MILNFLLKKYFSLSYSSSQYNLYFCMPINVLSTLVHELRFAPMFSFLSSSLCMVPMVLMRELAVMVELSLSETSWACLEVLLRLDIYERLVKKKLCALGIFLIPNAEISRGFSLLELIRRVDSMN